MSDDAKTAEIRPGDLVQAEPWAPGKSVNSAIFVVREVGDVYLTISPPDSPAWGSFRASLFVRVGRARWWPDGTPVEGE